MLDMLLLAAKIAVPNKDNDPREYWLAAIGIREDGTFVCSKNGAVHSTSVVGYRLIPSSHAEGRVIRKMDVGGIIYVARVLRRDRSLCSAKPCKMCSILIKSKGIEKVYYSIIEIYYFIKIIVLKS